MKRWRMPQQQQGGPAGVWARVLLWPQSEPIPREVSSAQGWGCSCSPPRDLRHHTQPRAECAIPAKSVSCLHLITELFFPPPHKSRPRKTAKDSMLDLGRFLVRGFSALQALQPLWWARAWPFQVQLPSHWKPSHLKSVVVTSVLNLRSGWFPNAELSLKRIRAQ